MAMTGDMWNGSGGAGGRRQPGGGAFHEGSLSHVLDTAGIQPG